MTDPHPTHDGPWTTEEATERRRPMLLLGIAAGTLVLGSVASTSAMLLSGWRYAPEREFTVAVYLQPDADERQRGAVENALTALPARDGVRLETRQEAYEKLRKKHAQDPRQLDGIEPETMPESLHLTAVGRNFDCGPIPGIRNLSGVDRIRVVLQPADGRWGAEVSC
ncbi:permease-like cell division protein FtsX [Actinoplanes utahensis]|uniref:FtsX extracellular domain-containing protein n=1 Tax=Actinoplanes utahensis TaxID=1869 RepID=A0A0A6UJF5_ACTUT|nr:permease-like cell division protein FtsX [Actinoplanes utahensis]KHD76230.1 hypothetical protein MB27_17530 [Actinoplanes utahensis]GIF30846.1 hypothetical protein Aut01nite_38320 [Actinoplanes utahensis]